MKKILLWIPLVVGLGSLACASTCPSGMTLATYDAPGFSCTLGDLTFSDFEYIPAASGGAISPPDSGVTVTPVTGTDTGFEFTAAWLAGPDQTIDSSISFDVSTTNPGGITDAFLEIVGSSAGTGSASVAELSTSTTPNLNLFAYYALGTIASPTDSSTFAPVGTLSLTKDIGVSGGTDGLGHLSDVFDLFSEGTSTVPEPPLSVLCLGLLGLLPIARRKFVR